MAASNVKGSAGEGDRDWSSIACSTPPQPRVRSLDRSEASGEPVRAERLHLYDYGDGRETRRRVAARDARPRWQGLQESDHLRRGRETRAAGIQALSGKRYRAREL